MMTQTSTVLIVVLAVALLVSLLMHAVGLAWAIMRERYFVRMTGQQTEAVRAIEQTFLQGTAAIRLGFKSLRKKINHSDELTAQKRRDMMQLMLDTEQRCMDAIRQLAIQLQLQGIHTGGNGPGVTIQGNTAGIQIGDGNKQEKLDQ